MQGVDRSFVSRVRRIARPGVRFLACAGLWLAGALLLAQPVQAQQVVDVEGPGEGETTYMMLSPRSLSEDVMIRAVGIRGNDGRPRFAYMMRGVEEGTAITLMANDAPVKVERMEVTTDAPRTVSVYVSASSVLTMANAASVSVTVGGERHPLPEDVKAALSVIYDQVQ
jgi:hypothetical protein